jgi:hypothetical protein
MAAVASLISLLLRSVLPYLDPLCRRRIRRAARDLITCTRWPGDDATPEDIAQLALLRLLWLQRQTRKAGRGRHTEATALLTRACIETCIAGLYWLYGDDQATRMHGNNAKSFRRMMSYIADGDPISPGLVEKVAATFGTPTDLPNLLDMANVVAGKTRESFATDVYHRIYVPLSTLFPHPSGLALLRHVKSDDQLAETPMRVWTIRSALHTSDACMARLALAVAERKQSTGVPFVRYANAHMSRSITPVFLMTGRSMIRSVRWSKLPGAYRSLVALRRYYDTGHAARDPYPERKARTKDAFDEALQVLDSSVPEQQRDLVLDHFAEVLAHSRSCSGAPE